MATQTHALPTVDQIDVANEALGKARSDLNWFVDAVESHSIVPSDEAIEALLRGEPVPESERLDADMLARIVVFATDVLEDAEVLEDEARKLLMSARALYHEHESSLDSARWAQNRRAVRAWHEQEAARGETVA